jgi:hypothetical protein
MNESTKSTRPSRLAGASHRLGVLAVLLLVLGGACIVGPVVSAGRSDLQGPSHEEVTGLILGAEVCEGVAAVAALAGFVLGIAALIVIPPAAGKVAGRGRAVSGLVTTSPILLALMVLHGLVLPWMEAKTRKLESANNLKVLGLAMMIYRDSYGHFPPAVLHDPALGDRAQPYSWRVALLPILGENTLYSQYRRDEPWDSPANKAVLASMPRVFAAPGSEKAAYGFTPYQVLVGPGTAFERPDVWVRWEAFSRGTEQTILAVEAAEPVFWTKPDDLSYVPDGPLPKVGGVVGSGFHALFADGTVRWFEPDQRESTLRTLVPLNGR